MTDVPKIVHHRLGASVPERTHLEADLLTAFAEQALSATEREGVLQHLALCADCREVVALALPTADLVQIPAKPQVEVARTPLPATVRTNWFAWADLHWAHLRWATLAAGIAVVVLVMRPGLEHMWKPSQPVSSIASQSPAPAQPPASASQVASGSIGAKSRAENPVEAKAVPAGASLDSSSTHSKAAKEPLPQSDLPAMLAGNLDKKAAVAGNLPARNRFVDSAPNAPRSATAAGKAFETAAVSPSDSTAADKLMARADAPAIEKAKPALKDSETANESQKTELQKTMAYSSQATSPAIGGMVALRAAAPAVITSKQNANWTIVDGVLQRSLDSGRSWQTVVRADHALLCYANRGHEVWAGGQAGTFLHSTDGGTTWSTIAVSFAGHALSSDVTHIDVRSPAEIVLTTDNHETWSSADGGQTWEKK
jgi:hypothetical protein